MEKIKCFGFDMDYTLAGKYNVINSHVSVCVYIYSAYRMCSLSGM